MRLLYVLGTWVAFAVVFPVLALMKKTRDGAGQRLGFYPRGLLPEGPGPRIWLHGASAGDLLALSPMIDRLRARFPDAKVIVSTITNTGHLMARERLKKQIDAVVYAPWDLWGATRRAVRAISAEPAGAGVHRDLAQPDPRGAPRRRAGGAHQRALLARSTCAGTGPSSPSSATRWPTSTSS